MTPASAIASLDRQLAAHGEDCILRRKEGSPLVVKDIAVRASVRGLRSDELVGAATQAWSRAVMSMSQILTADWPAGHVVVEGDVDPRIPRASDYLVVKGRQRQIMFADPIAMDGTIVRINLTVAG